MLLYAGQLDHSLANSVKLCPKPFRATPAFWSENSMDWSPWGCTELYRTGRLAFSLLYLIQMILDSYFSFCNTIVYLNN